MAVMRFATAGFDNAQRTIPILGSAHVKPLLLVEMTARVKKSMIVIVLPVAVWFQ